MPPRLAVGIVAMCHQLLRLKRGEKADVKFISGFPSVRPGFSAAALREALGEDAVNVDQQVVNAVKIWFKSGFSVADLLTVGFSVSDLVAAGLKQRDVFIAAALSKIDVKVRLKLDAPYNFTEICTP